LRALAPVGESDPQGQLRANTVRGQLEKARWNIGGNLQLDFPWGTGDADWVRSAIERALQKAPDVLLANGDAAIKGGTATHENDSRHFIGGGDVVADGVGESLAHPGGNMTGFAVMEPSLGSKLLGMLKQVAPRGRACRRPDQSRQRHAQTHSCPASGRRSRLSVKIISAPAREAAEIDEAMGRWGQVSDCGVIVPSDPATNSHRKLCVELAGRYRLPTVYALRAAVADGGLMSYGVDLIELLRQAARYADRILKGEKPADLPVQLPTKFELVVNLKTARELGIELPHSLRSPTK
jgi:putative ABC transport system substrate-binding protein